MPVFAAVDGTELFYRVSGSGAPVICLPGGPMQSAAYLDDLGGLSAHRQLILLDLRGTGGSAIPQDARSYRCDRLVDDVDALRVHLELDRTDVLAHSAGANLAARYVQRHPHRVGRLALIGPSVRAVGITITPDVRLEAARLRRDEVWFPDAFAALEAVVAGTGDDEAQQAIVPFFYGHWDEQARMHHAARPKQTNSAAAKVFGADGAFDPPTTRAALARFERPVLILTGELDLNSPPQVMAEYAALFRHATLDVQPGAGHYPWLDDAGRFVAIVGAFLA